MINYENQEGVTLVIAIVLLSAVTFVSFTLSTVTLRELKSARLLTNTEPAFAGANAGGEVGLYRLQRGTGNVGSVNQRLSQSGASFDVVPDLLDFPYFYTVAGRQTLAVGLYDPENIENQQLLYRSVSIANQARSVRVTVASWSNPNNPVCNDISVRAGAVLTCTLTGPDFRYLITLRNLGGGTADGNIRSWNQSFQPTGPATTNPPGVPSEWPQIDVLGQSGEVRRKIQIKF